MWQAVPVTSWIRNVTEPLNSDQQLLLDGLAAVVEQQELAQLDAAASSTVALSGGLHLTFVHRTDTELNIDVDHSAPGDEIIVSYGPEHLNFRSDDARAGLVFPFPSNSHLEATLALVQSLLTGRVELHLWKRPFSIKTRSYWVDDDGQPVLFARTGTLGPFFGWSRGPKVYRFDFT